MANIATAEFAADCSNAGALGVLASGAMNGEQLRAQIRKCQELTDKPFGVNLMLMNPNMDELSDVVIEEGVKILTTGAGSPVKYMAKWKAAGIKIFPVVPSAMLAKRMEKYGADGVIAEGTEAGGHVGETTTMALLPQVVDAVSIAVIGAGGIADGRQLAAVIAMGAVGAQIGTCLLASQECPIHANYKNAVIAARDRDTVVTGRASGAPVRILKNKMSRAYLRLEQEGATLEELEKYTLGSLRRAVFDGDTENGSLMAGQVAGMVHEIRPLATIFNEFMTTYQATVEKLQATK